MIHFRAYVDTSSCLHVLQPNSDALILIHKLWGFSNKCLLLKPNVYKNWFLASFDIKVIKLYLRQITGSIHLEEVKFMCRTKLVSECTAGTHYNELKMKKINTDIEIIKSLYNLTSFLI